MDSDSHAVSRVTRSKAQAKASYDRMSLFYDYFTGSSEQRYNKIALELLHIAQGEMVLEIGYGTGHGLKQIAGAVGAAGRVYGIDISSGMRKVSQQRLAKAKLLDRVELICDDALKMPYRDCSFDAAFAGFVLELFDTPEIPIILTEIARVLRPAGRMGIVSLSKEASASRLLSLYEWLHERLPQYIDCRPIYVERVIRDAGFEIRHAERVSLFGLPGEIIIGTKPKVPA